MNIPKKATISIVTVIVIIAVFIFYPQKNTKRILLTWDHEDTAHTITVNYVNNNSQAATVYYDTTSHGGIVKNYRYQTQAETRTYPGINFHVHSTRLINLDPEQSYYFIVGDESDGYSKERKFKTVPLRGDIRFISGGDTGITETYADISKIAASSNPHFAILGGDIAYGNGDINSQQRWLDLLDIWQHAMITPDGYTIPVIAVIGNHDTNTSKPLATRTLSDSAPFFDLIFRPAADKTFFKRKIGSDTILFVLDTDHIYSSADEQLEWMRENFAQHKNNKFRFSSYHVPLYPSFYDPDSPHYVSLRKNWLELFDQYHLQVTFENHEHTLKKSRPLKNHQLTDKQGTIYIGDGNWGVASRKPKDRWYLEATRAINHIWAVTLNENTASFKVLTVDGIEPDFSFEIKASDHNPAP